MYLTFYNLSEKPFGQSSDPAFLWLGEKHKEALSTLRYGVLDNKGFLLLTGDSGIGKTTIINSLTSSLESDVEWAVISDPRLERIDFYNAIANGFGIDKQFTSKVQFLIQFSHFLHKSEGEGKKVVLLVDECHLLDQEMLEELRLLSNIEKSDSKLINIFFIGQKEFNEMLVNPKNRAVRQRLTLKADISPLNGNETQEYIKHRLKVAGAADNLFSAKAAQLVYKYSKGVPKRINVLCEYALVAGEVQKAATIDHKIIEDCTQKLQLPTNPEQEDFEEALGGEEQIEKFKEKFDVKIPGGSRSAPIEVIGEKQSRGWLKYVAATAILLIAGIYLWYPGQQVPQKSTVEEVVQQPVVEQGQTSTTESPAVQVLEDQAGDINGEKAAELKTAILEKAYGEKAGETLGDQKSLAVPKEEKVADTTPATMDKPVVTPPDREDKIASSVLKSDTSEKSLAPVSKSNNLTEKTAGVQDGVQEKVAESANKEQVDKASTAEKGVDEETVEPTQVVESVLPPLEPKKVTLALQPNSLKLTRAAGKDLEKFVEVLKQYPKATLLVKGFVSAKTNSPENIKLSEDRAAATQKLLIDKGIDPEQVEVKGMGNLEPLASNATYEGRKKNRRVEIIVISDGLQ